jgi:hypothetical protein
MKAVLVSLMLLFSAASWAGGEVPWPKDNLQDIDLRNMGGLWVSQHLDSPQRLFFFNLERGGITDACPFVLRAFEVDVQTSELVSAGGGVFCSQHLDAMTIVMYDFSGHAQYNLHLVGLRKPVDSSYLGAQMLGVTLTTFETKPSFILQDSFYMVSQ